jgi:hypothetical protein
LWGGVAELSISARFGAITGTRRNVNKIRAKSLDFKPLFDNF